jgi:hypothetical protein
VTADELDAARLTETLDRRMPAFFGR